MVGYRGRGALHAASLALSRLNYESRQPEHCQGYFYRWPWRREGVFAEHNRLRLCNRGGSICADRLSLTGRKVRNGFFAHLILLNK